MSALDQIAKYLNALEESQRSDSSKKLEALEGLLTEMNTALSDVVALMEKSQKEEGGSGITQSIYSLTEALKNFRSDTPKVEVAAPVVHVAAPSVEVKVPAAQITNEVNVQPAQIHVVDRQRVKHWRVEHKYFSGVIESSVLTPIYEDASK